MSFFIYLCDWLTDWWAKADVTHELWPTSRRIRSGCHPSIHISDSLSNCGLCVGGLRLAEMVRKATYTLDRSLVHHRANTRAHTIRYLIIQTYSQIRINKLPNLGATQSGTESVRQLHTERPHPLWTFFFCILHCYIPRHSILGLVLCIQLKRSKIKCLIQDLLIPGYSCLVLWSHVGITNH